MRHLNRRQFLEETVPAAAASAASSRVLLAGEPGKQSKSPNDRQNVAVLGVRSRGGNRAKAFDSASF